MQFSNFIINYIPLDVVKDCHKLKTDEFYIYEKAVDMLNAYNKPVTEMSIALEMAKLDHNATQILLLSQMLYN